MPLPPYVTDDDAPLTPLDYFVLRRCERANALGIHPSKSRLAQPLSPLLLSRTFRWQVERVCRRGLLDHIVTVHPRYTRPMPDTRPFAGGGTYAGRRWRLVLNDDGRAALAELTADQLAEIDSHLTDGNLRALAYDVPGTREFRDDEL